MGNHIVLAVDRAGIVPDDGETHQGIFDVPFLTTIPRVVIYSPSTFAELEINLKQALYDRDGVAVVRYPKGGELPGAEEFVPDYKAYTHLRHPQAKTLLVTYGRIFSHALTAARELMRAGTPVSVLKLTRIWPLSEEALQLARAYDRIFFFEEGSRRGGIAQAFGEALLEQGYRGSYTVQALEGPLPACSVSTGLRWTGLDADGMTRKVLEALHGD